jgi:hypothetical protein
MNTCDTCRFWDGPDSLINGYGHCQNDKLQADDLGYPTDGLSGGEPAECTSIRTGPKFGCIHHQPVVP